MVPHQKGGYNNTVSQGCLEDAGSGCMRRCLAELNLSRAIFGCVLNRCAVRWMEDAKVDGA